MPAWMWTPGWCADMSRRARTQPYPDLFAGLAANEVAPAATGRVRPVTPSSAEPAAADTAPVWICLHLPGLPLQALRHECPSAQPCAVVTPGQSHQVVATNRLACAAGVVPGQAVRTALALCAELVVRPRVPQRETELLADIAGRLMAFSPTVSLVPPQAVLLEVRGSLRLFQGILPLLERLLGQLQGAGYQVRHAVAPTPRAACWLARAGLTPEPPAVTEAGTACAQFQQLLGGLDLAVTDWPEGTVVALRDMGVDTIADCRRLPRAGLARRFGPAIAHSLAQAFGELPDVREALTPVARFEATLQLDAEIDTAALLQPACDRLLVQLETTLRTRQAAVRVLEFRLHAWQGEAGRLQVSLSAPGHRQEDWQPVLAAQLESVVLTQPVVALTLVAGASEPLQPEACALPLEQSRVVRGQARATHALLDQLRARLGEQSVTTLQHVADHRPEYASRNVPVSVDQPVDTALPPSWCLEDVASGGSLHPQTWRRIWLQRPLWLLDEPLELEVVSGRPCYRGQLALRHGPERIGAGWWDRQTTQRDYFVANGSDSTRLWVYRTREAQRTVRWWLHGLFG